VKVGQVLLECPAALGNGLGSEVLAQLLAREEHAIHLVSVPAAQAAV